MQSYDDGKGTKRLISLSIGKAKKINAALKIDLIDGDVPAIYGQLMVAPNKRLEMLWLMLDDRGELTKEQFDDSLTAEVCSAVTPVFFEELDFFILSLRPEMETVIKELRAKAATVIEIQNKMISDFANSPEMETALTDAMEQLKKELSDDLPKQFQSALAPSA